MNNEKFNPLLSGYLSYLSEVKRLSKRTVIDIKCTFKKTIKFMKSIQPKKDLWELCFDDFLKWIEYERQDGKSNQSISKQISHIRCFFDYVCRNGRGNRNVLDGFYLQDGNQKISPRVLTLEEAKKIIEVCGRKNKQQRRKRIIILLLYGCGLRTQELCSLNIQDIDIERQELFVIKAKGDIQRQMPVSPAVWTELLAYMNERGAKRGSLFKTEVKGKRINPVEVSSIVKEAGLKAGLKDKITPKTLRHTFATHLMDAGVNLAVISSLMGHRSPRETGVYLHAFKERKETAVNQLKTFEPNKEV